MLVPAWTERTQLVEAFNVFERSSSWSTFYTSSARSEGAVDADDWARVQRVSVDPKGRRLHGYAAASIDRDARRVREICAVAFVEGSLLWARDLGAFMRGLVEEFEVVHWSARGDSANAAMYRRAVERHGGRVVGRFSRYGRLPGGRLVDVEWYEILGRGGRVAGEP